MSRTVPDTFSWPTPILTARLKYQVTDKEGQIVERYSELSFGIGWHRLGTPTELGFFEIDVNGSKLFIGPNTLEMIKGKQLVLETVRVGFPNPADKTRQLLVCREVQ